MFHKPAVLFVLLAMLTSCEHFEAGTPEPESDLVAPGPGVFTGRSGEWKVIRQR